MESLQLRAKVLAFGVGALVLGLLLGSVAALQLSGHAMAATDPSSSLHAQDGHDGKADRSGVAGTTEVLEEDWPWDLKAYAVCLTDGEAGKGKGGGVRKVEQACRRAHLENPIPGTPPPAQETTVLAYSGCFAGGVFAGVDVSTASQFCFDMHLASLFPSDPPRGFTTLPLRPETNWPWDYVAYATCWWGGVGGGGDPIDVGDDCKKEWIK